MDFEAELQSVLPPDLPRRERVVEGCSEHLRRIVEVNQVMNLTRITSPREAAIKHVLDSVIPWRLFADARQVLDAGTGAGFPGIPLALVLPDVQFTLAESIRKKARFVDETVHALGMPNVEVRPERAEAIPSPVITARAVAPMPKLLTLFRPALKRGSRLLLYKGPEEEGGEIAMQYELPDGMGSRRILAVNTSGRTHVL